MIYTDVPYIDYKIKTIEGFPMKKIESYDLTPCDVIFSHVNKPKDFLMCKSTNVFDDRWRVNIYSKRYVEGIEGKYISGSYFIHFDKSNGDLTIVSPKT